MEAAHEEFSVLSTEGRVVGPWWEKLKPKGPRGAHEGFSEDRFRGTHPELSRNAK